MTLSLNGEAVATDPYSMPDARRILLRIARVALVSLFWMSPCAALGAGLGEAPPAAVWIILGLGVLSLTGAWLVDRKLRVTSTRPQSP